MTKTMHLANTTWEWGKKTYIMGILNTTPDSFSDGGSYDVPDKALGHARSMIEEGADIIDVGGESTRPGGTPVSEENECARVLPVIHMLREATDLPISIDTYKARTASQAIEAGASMINDIWGLREDPEMAEVASSCDVPICIMHNRHDSVYDNLIADMLRDLEQSLEIAAKAGIRNENIIIDPGIGFGKTVEQNLQVLAHLDELQVFGLPVLLGASRKSVIGKTLDLGISEREEGTMAITALGICKGVDIVRVHAVRKNVRVARMIDAIER